MKTLIPLAILAFIGFGTFAQNQSPLPKISQQLTDFSSYYPVHQVFSTNLMDVIKSIKPFRLMNNQIVFYGSENSINAQGGALLVLDGQQLGTDVSAIQSISTSEVDYINVSTNPMDIQRYTGLNSVGVIEIFQKKAPQITTQTTGKLNIGNQANKAFQAEPANARRDIRTTLQWIPELKIGETGEAEITVTAGKVLTDFIIEIQGMGANGLTGSGKGSFSVVK